MLNLNKTSYIIYYVLILDNMKKLKFMKISSINLIIQVKLNYTKVIYKIYI